MLQKLEVGGLANTSFQGSGVGKPILENESIVTVQIYDSANSSTGLMGTLSWTGTSWNTSINVADLSEGLYFIQLIFTNNSPYYSAVGKLNSSPFAIAHILNITSISQSYNGNTTQINTVEVRANTSYQGLGLGTPIENNPDAIITCSVVNNSDSRLTDVSGLAVWNEISSSWKAYISTSSLPEGDYYIMVNFSVISSQYNASSIQNTTTFTVKHVLTLYIPTPIFNPDNATVDIVGIIALDSYSVYHHINDTTVLSTYFEIFNYSSKESIGIYGGLTYNATFDDWRNISIDLSDYIEGFLFIRVNISSIDVPEGAVMNSSPFELVHKLIISGISLEYSADFNQTLNITVGNVYSTYKYSSGGEINHAHYYFFFVNNQTAVETPNLGGNLTKTGSIWQELANVSQLPEGDYYVVVTFADLTAANSKGSASTTNFTIIHRINVSTPIISYIDQMDQLLNISCYANSSYYYHRLCNSPIICTGYYRIYLGNDTPTSITGDLEWNGVAWVAKNADVSLLPVGSYRIKCYFSTNYASASSLLSNTFTVNHSIEITTPSIMFNNITKQLTILHMNALSSFSTHGYLTNLTAQSAYFVIFNQQNQSTGISGQLSWNGTEWQAINFATPSLAEGIYYVKIYFNDSQTSLTDISSDFFEAKYLKEEFDWMVIVITLLVVAAIIIVLFWSFVPVKPKQRSEEI